MIYIKVVNSDGDIISMQSSEGMSESTALALISTMFPGCKGETTTKAIHDAWVKEHGPQY